MEIALTVFAIACLLALSAFFSGSETALTAASRARMRARADQGEEAAVRVNRLTEDGERLIGSILLGNNVVNILATALTTALFTQLFEGDSGLATLFATILMTALVLIFSEVLPKTYAYANAETAAVRVSWVISWLVWALSPVVSLVRMLVRALLSTAGVTLEKDAKVLSREAHEEIRGAIDLHHFDGHVERDNRNMLLAALDLNQREVTEVMSHRRDIFTVDADAPPAEAVEAVIASPYTRVPIWRDDPENIIGVLHAKDLLRAVVRRARDADARTALDGLDLAAIAMEPVFTPDATRLQDQLQEFMRRRGHFALVVDEYGALQGLITLEDILEEIVGEIADEHDIDESDVAEVVDGWYVVEGQTTIRDLNRAFDWRLPDDEATTIAGLVIHEAQVIPPQGAAYIFHGFRFEVLERVRHRITLLKMRPENSGLGSGV